VRHLRKIGCVKLIHINGFRISAVFSGKTRSSIGGVWFGHRRLREVKARIQCVIRSQMAASKR
jgi:hypothetical protein